jgi:PAS domain S-box-containing protein
LHLRSALPEQYRIWARTSIWIVFLGYCAVVASQILVGGLGGVWSNRDPYAALLCVFALVLEKRGQAVAGAWLATGTLWVEAHITLITAGLGGSSVPVFPGLVLAIGLLFGGRVALLAAIASCFVALFGSTLAERLHLGAGLQSEDIARLVVLVLSVAGSGFFLHIIMYSFGLVLQRSRKQEAQAKELVEYSPDAIIVFDADCRVVEFNPSAERTLGLLRQQALGATLSQLPLEDRAKRALNQSQRFEETSHVPEALVATLTQRSVEALYRRTVHADATRGLMMVLRDTTDRTAAEKRAAELELQLQHAQKLEAVGQLAGGVAHDFNNLLTTVGGYAALLARSPDPRAREYAEELNGVQQRGASLTRQLLSFARKEVVRPRLLDLANVLAGTKSVIHRFVGEQIRLVFEVKGPCPIYSDPGQLEQVLLNLCSNARDAMPQGGELRIECATDGRDVVLRVSDTGLGMDEATRRRVFEPFFTTKPRGRGTGLGLSTVHGIVNESGGNIEVRSRPGQGTTLELRWPKSIEHANEAPRSSPIRLAEGVGHILFVEDDEHSRRFIQRLLKEAGYQVTCACQAEEALAVLPTLNPAPELLLTDIIMPGMSGVELSDQVALRLPGLPVLFISGYPDDALRHRAVELGQDLLLKPFSAEDLLDRIGRKLGKSSGQTAPRQPKAPPQEPAADN